MHDVAAHVAHGDPPVLGHLAHDLDEVLAPLGCTVSMRGSGELTVASCFSGVVWP